MLASGVRSPSASWRRAGGAGLLLLRGFTVAFTVSTIPLLPGDARASWGRPWREQHVAEGGTGMLVGSAWYRSEVVGSRRPVMHLDQYTLMEREIVVSRPT